MTTTPIWTWLPGRDEPILAADLEIDRGARFIYRPDFLATEGALALDPVELRLNRSARGTSIRGTDGLPGVVRDAKPAGYGADRLMAIHGDQLDPLQLLELGVPDSVGAIEACTDIERKLEWRPKGIDHLEALTQELESHEPASRALRRLNDDLDTSAGGERPKATLVDDGKLWLVKMQDRGDRPAMPAREYVAMSLADQVGIDAAPVRLHTFGAHQVLMVERFDRGGDPSKPTRKLYASAHTVLRLQPATVKGDPSRSYLVLADNMRIWMRNGPGDYSERVGEQLAELWRRIAFNALVGNTDDHALNTGLLYDSTVDGSGMAWALSPAFDITPNMGAALQRIEDGPYLSLATGVDGQAGTSVSRLLEAARVLGLDPDQASIWIYEAARFVAHKWEAMLREAARPIIPDAARMDQLVDSARISFAYAEWLAHQGAKPADGAAPVAQ